MKSASYVAVTLSISKWQIIRSQTSWFLFRRWKWAMGKLTGFNLGNFYKWTRISRILRSISIPVTCITKNLFLLKLCQTAGMWSQSTAFGSPLCTHVLCIYQCYLNKYTQSKNCDNSTEKGFASVLSYYLTGYMGIYDMEVRVFTCYMCWINPGQKLFRQWNKVTPANRKRHYWIWMPLLF